MMKFLKFSAASALAFLAAAEKTSDPKSVHAILDSTEFSAADKFGLWKNLFSRHYSTAAQEKKAFEAFENNERIINEHNGKDLTFTLGHNDFSDMNWDEFKAAYVSGMDSNPYLRRERNFVDLPEATADAVDWTAKGAVTPVKNQGAPSQAPLSFPFCFLFLSFRSLSLLSSFGAQSDHPNPIPLPTSHPLPLS